MLKKGKTQPWFFDFRITQTLPDIKFIRTNFILSFVSLFFFLGCLGFFFYDRMSLNEKEDKARRLTAEVNSFASGNKENLELSARFLENQNPLKEFSSFYEGELPLAYLLESLSRGCPDDLAFSQVSYFMQRVPKNPEEGGRRRGRRRKSKDPVEMIKKGQVVLSGAVRGSAQEALVLLDDYKRLLQAMPIIRDQVASIAVVPQGRAESSQFINFSITINLNLSS